MKRPELLGLLLAVSIPMLQDRVDQSGVFSLKRQVAHLYLDSGEHVKRLCPGFEMLMADIYWLRTVQYYGGQVAFNPEPSFELLEPLIDITTTLDTRLDIAYRFGATFLSEGKPVGASNPDAGIKLLEKGVRNNPHSWRIGQYLGQFYFIFKKDSDRACQALMEAAAVPGAPIWLKTLCGDIARKGGKRGMSRAIWQSIYDQEAESGGPMKGNAEWHLQQLDALDAAEALQILVGRFKQERGRNPRALAELQAIGWLNPLPKDPLGHPFAFSEETGVVSILKESPLWRSH